LEEGVTAGMKKQAPPKPKPPSQADERQQLQRSLERYTCTLDKSTSEQARLLGLERSQTVCALVSEAVQEYIQKGGSKGVRISIWHEQYNEMANHRM
jgi:hypothetical protein